MRPRPVKARCIYTSLFEVRQSTVIGLTEIDAESDRVVESGKQSFIWLIRFVMYPTTFEVSDPNAREVLPEN